MQLHGIDMVEISRIGAAIDTWGQRFLHRVYTKAEIEYCQGRVASLAVRFAAKEAVMKALGSGNIGVSWQDIEVLPNENGAPVLHLRGGAASKLREFEINALTISLSHTKDYAMASVLGGKDD